MTCGADMSFGHFGQSRDQIKGRGGAAPVARLWSQPRPSPGTFAGKPIFHLPIFLLFFLALIVPQARAHESRPLAVVIEELGAEQYKLLWKTPASVDSRNAPALSIGAPCVEASAALTADGGMAIYRCPGGLEGAALSVAYPAYNPSVSTLVRVVWKSGEVSTQALGPDIREWRAPAPATFSGVAKSYFTLGVKHILIGLDHILFLAGMLMLARTPRRILVTVTGFTFAHSLTLALVALDVLRVSPPAIEAAIALSIVFVAAEIARGNRETLAFRRPILVATAFGLLHGAGFAAVLGEIGLPQTERVAALLFFNAGVEAGQVLVVAGAFSFIAIVSAARTFANDGVPAPLPALAPRLASYSLGILSAYWFIGRAMALFV